MYIGGIVKKHVFTLVILFVTASMALGQSKLETNFSKLADEVLQNLQSFYPVRATAKGIHDYDYRFTDYSGLSDKSRINLKLLKSNVDVALVELSKIKIYKKNPYLYIDDAVRTEQNQDI